MQTFKTPQFVHCLKSTLSFELYFFNTIFDKLFYSLESISAGNPLQYFVQNCLQSIVIVSLL